MTWLRPRVTRRSALVFAVWSALVAGALIYTLPAMRPSEDFDGLNNLAQLPFALPWFVLPIGAKHQAAAWIAAGEGWFNGVLLLLFLPSWLDHQPTKARSHEGWPDFNKPPPPQ